MRLSNVKGTGPEKDCTRVRGSMMKDEVLRETGTVVTETSIETEIETETETAIEPETIVGRGMWKG